MKLGLARKLRGQLVATGVETEQLDQLFSEALRKVAAYETKTAADISLAALTPVADAGCDAAGLNGDVPGAGARRGQGRELDLNTGLRQALRRAEARQATLTNSADLLLSAVVAAADAAAERRSAPRLPQQRPRSRRRRPRPYAAALTVRRRGAAARRRRSATS